MFDASTPAHWPESGQFGRNDRCASCRGSGRLHAMPRSHHGCPSANATLMWTRRLQNRFLYGMCYRGGGRKTQSRLCRRRKGGGRDLTAWSVVVPSKPGTSRLDTAVHQGTTDEWKIGFQSIQEPRQEKEGRRKGARRSARVSGEVLIPNRPGFRLGWPVLNQRSHPRTGGANRLDWLFEARPGTGTG